MATESSTLVATPRNQAGKGFARRLRAKGLIPAVCYGPHDKPLAFAVDPIALKKAIATPLKFNTVVTLNIEGGASKTVLLKDFDKDPMDGRVLHADFLEVRMDQDVTVEVPVVLTGKHAGAAEGGILQQVLRTIQVRTLPGKIPEKLEVDVTPLGIAESLHVSDVKAPAGITFKTPGTQTVAVVGIPEKEVEAVKPVAAAAEGAAAAGAGTGAPAAGDARAGDAKAEAGKPAPAAAKGGKK